MRTALAQLGLAVIAALTFASPAAFAKPIVAVKVGVPTVGVVIAPQHHHPNVVVRHAPGPQYMWVEGAWKRDRWGRPVFVQGYWAPRPVVVHRPGHTVIVRKY